MARQQQRTEGLTRFYQNQRLARRGCRLQPALDGSGDLRTAAAQLN